MSCVSFRETLILSHTLCSCPLVRFTRTLSQNLAEVCDILGFHRRRGVQLFGRLSACSAKGLSLFIAVWGMGGIDSAAQRGSAAIAAVVY
jgi:hypothetical protein